MNVPETLKYCETHEWARLEEGAVVVGISDFAQHELTDIVFVELPEVGRAVAAKEACCVVESTKVASDVYAPVAGTITAVNADLATHPDWINQSPYEKGWLFRIAPASPAELESLLDSTAYRGMIHD